MYTGYRGYRDRQTDRNMFISFLSLLLPLMVSALNVDPNFILNPRGKEINI